MGVSSLPKTVTRQRRGCDLNPGPSAPESSTLSTRLPSHPPRAGGIITWSGMYTYLWVDADESVSMVIELFLE